MEVSHCDETAAAAATAPTTTLTAVTVVSALGCNGHVVTPVSNTSDEKLPLSQSAQSQRSSTVVETAAVGSSSTLSSSSSSTGLPPPRQSSELRLFLHQVTGHNILLKYDKQTLGKPLIERELRFYKYIPVALQPFVPRYKGAIDVVWIEDENNIAHIIGKPLNDNGISSPTVALAATGSSSNNLGGNDHFQIRILHTTDNDHLEIEPPKNVDGKIAKVALEARSTSFHPWSLEHCASELNKLRLAIEREGNIQFILLENLTQKFSFPCVLDLKMGTRLHGDDESEQKKERKMRRSIDTTSYQLGVRLGGMEVYDVTTGVYRVFDKYHGRSLSPSQLKASVWQFLHNGRRCRYELIKLFRRRLDTVIETLQRIDSFRFFSSSLLLIYDGLQPPQQAVDSSDVPASNLVVDVRMVDFAHTTWPEIAEECGTPRYAGPDAGYLLGLKTICDYLDEFLAMKAQPPPAAVNTEAEGEGICTSDVASSSSSSSSVVGSLAFDIIASTSQRDAIVS